jgi:hypothetical protein
MTDKHQMTAVIATFADRRQADRFVEKLTQAGFRNDEIGVMALHEESTGTKVEEGAAAGAVTGGALGAFTGAVATGLIPGVGPIVATGLLAGVLGGAAAGATAGGALGALIGLGIPEDEARRHEEEFLAGRTLVVVQALGRGTEALAILQREQATAGRRSPLPVGQSAAR